MKTFAHFFSGQDWKDDRIRELEHTLLASSNTNVSLMNKNSLLQDDLRRATERWKKAEAEVATLKTTYCEVDWRPTRSCNADDPNMEDK